MKEENMRFGEYIRKKRQCDPREITQSDVAKQIGISLSYLSDIELGKRNPFDTEAIEKFCVYLDLSDVEKALMFDLAAKEKSAVPADIEDVLMHEEIGTMARFALRESKAGNVTEDDWKRFIREIEAKKNRG